jgi:hypothetical protein
MPYWFEPQSVTLELGGTPLKIETGRMAKQAAGAAVVTYGDTVVLVTVTTSKPREGIDFFPLTVDFVEKTSAAGKIPGGFFKREARLSDREILVCRFIDRSIRPLFAEGFRDEGRAASRRPAPNHQHVVVECHWHLSCSKRGATLHVPEYWVRETVAPTFPVTACLKRVGWSPRSPSPRYTR